MGYYTTFHLEVRNINHGEFDRLWKHLEEQGIFGDECHGAALASFDYSPERKRAYFYPAGECTWYDYREDMQEVAKLFPDVLFCLECDGEYKENPWRVFYHGDRYEHCSSEVVFEEPAEIEWEDF